MRFARRIGERSRASVALCRVSYGDAIHGAAAKGSAEAATEKLSLMANGSPLWPCRSNVCPVSWPFCFFVGCRFHRSPLPWSLPAPSVWPLPGRVTEQTINQPCPFPPPPPSPHDPNRAHTSRTAAHSLLLSTTVMAPRRSKRASASASRTGANDLQRKVKVVTEQHVM